MEATTVAFTLNGDRVTVDAPPAERLSNLLRERLGKTGTKVGCDAGDCGACTVLMDGEPVCGCMVPAGRLDGRDVVTVEGLAANGTLSRLQRAFLHHGAAQCGICTPGMLVSAASLLRKNEKPTEQQVMDALGGVLCRCTGYRKIVSAVMEALDFDAPSPVAARGKAVGAALERLDGEAKVRGTDIFGADRWPDDALVVRVIRSPHHHADFAFGDIEAFVADHPGIETVLTAADIPGENRFGVIPPFAEQPVFAEKTARFRGEAVAAIAGEAAAMAALDLDDFPVTWTERPAYLHPQEAEADGAVPLHADREGNVLTGGFVKRGDAQAGLDEADTVVEGSYSTGFIEHAYIEPEAGFARRTGNRVEIHACTQAPYMDRDDMARIMGLGPEDIRIVPTAVGGGFGSKLDISLQPYVALAAWKTGRPARIVYTRADSMMSTTKRHPSRIRARIGATRDGRITGMDFLGTFNTGAYASWGPTVANRVPVHASGPYVIPNYRAESRAIHTHCAPSGAFRGFGVPQSAIAQETLFDELADAIGMDRLEFRLLNALDNGQPTVTGQVFDKGVGIKACLDALKPHWERARREAREANGRANGPATRRGVGLAAGWYGCGNTSLPNPSTIKAGLTPDGRVMLHQGAVDIGQGSNTVVAQIFADALGIPVHDIRLVGGDTDITPDAGKTSASRQTFVSGNAARLAGEALRTELLRLGNVSSEAEIALDGGTLVLTDTNGERRVDLSGLAGDANGYVACVAETYDPPTAPLDENGQGVPYAVFGYAAHMVELEVDEALGRVKLLKLTAAHDVGRAINPVLVEGQVEGGAAQGVGLALMEEFIPGRTDNLHDYLIPTFGDMPKVETLIVEVEDAHGPYGAKGLGEHTLIPTAPAILNAIRDACGVLVRNLPATPDKVRTAIAAARAEDTE